jgi:hypothetical protein
MEDVDVGLVFLRRVDRVTEGISGILAEVGGVKNIFDARYHEVLLQSLKALEGT